MKEALKLALEALKTEQDIYREHDEDGAPEYILEAITAIKEALAQPEQEPSYATTWLSGHAQGLEDGVAMKLEKPSVTPFGLPLFWDAPAPLPDGSLINEGTKNIEQEPVEMYRSKCADGSRCLHGCHTNEPCYTTPPQRKEPEQSTTCGEPVAWSEEQAYDWGRGCYEIAQGATTGWKLFGQLTPKEQAYWVAKAAFEKTTPPQRKPLTDEQIDEIEEATWDEDHKSWGIHDFVRAIEAAHGIKGDA